MGVCHKKGRDRQYWEIRGFLNEKGHSFTSFARSVGVSSQQVGRTVQGLDNSQKVLKALIELGCPISLLDLPDNMQAELA